MSLPGPRHNFFIVFAPDVPNAQEARARHLPAHMERVQRLAQSGLLRLGGGLLPPDVRGTDPDAAEKIRGGFIIVKAENIEEAWKIVKEDILYTSGEVWDREKIIVESLYLAMPEARFD
ncbi:hypothetical protein C8Q70DRAFT_928051 [Cubamyces menziesii]|uniref:YCII-related domain-containing protein n=1 Tax=Trametes cubensis TaxID=1111947 RepID=A0AAD7TZQ6_9APHY|nr:hypothetical protein C8Q70DRAFT_928051 [Cubamyces menziesii]KAJ8489350.1 hypothetical protein ONZ51_g2993 [Trametes cubensis]